MRIVKNWNVKHAPSDSLNTRKYHAQWEQLVIQDKSINPSYN